MPGGTGRQVSSCWVSQVGFGKSLQSGGTRKQLTKVDPD